MVSRAGVCRRPVSNHIPSTRRQRALCHPHKKHIRVIALGCLCLHCHHCRHRQQRTRRRLRPHCLQSIDAPPVHQRGSESAPRGSVLTLTAEGERRACPGPDPGMRVAASPTSHAKSAATRDVEPSPSSPFARREAELAPDAIRGCDVRSPNRCEIVRATPTPRPPLFPLSWGRGRFGRLRPKSVRGPPVVRLPPAPPQPPSQRRPRSSSPSPRGEADAVRGNR